MNVPIPLTYSLCFCLALLEACGPNQSAYQQDPPPMSSEQGGGLVDDEVVKDAVLTIETTETFGGPSVGCRCDDDASRGYGGTSKMLTNDGNRYTWWGCWRIGKFEGDPNSGMRCSTGGETALTIEPNNWMRIKKELLGLNLQNLAGQYDCNNTSIPCFADYGGPTHEIEINGQKFTISYTIDPRYLPLNVQRFDAILKAMDISQSDLRPR